MSFDRRGQLVIGICGHTSGGLRVSAQQDRGDVQLSVAVGGCVQVFVWPVTMKKTLGVGQVASPGTRDPLVGRVDVNVDSSRHRLSLAGPPRCAAAWRAATVAPYLPTAARASATRNAPRCRAGFRQ